MRPAFLNRPPGTVAVVGRQIVEANNIAFLKGRGELRFDVLLECITVQGALDHPGRGQAVTAQSGNEGHGFPMTMGNGGNHPLASGTAPPQARHFGIDTCFVKEHDPADPLGMGQEPGLTFAPNHACCLHIRAFPVHWRVRFFLKLILRARNQSLIVEVGAITS